MVDPEKSPESYIDVVVTPKLISWIGLLTAVAVGFDFLRGLTHSSNPWFVIGYITVLTLASLLLLLPNVKISHYYFLYMLAGHAFLATALIWLVPTLSYYLFPWILLTYLSGYYYQSRGTFLSLSGLFVVMVTSLAVQDGGFLASHFIEAAPYFISFTGLTILLARITLGNSQQRLVMTKKITESEYEHQRLIALINSVSDAVVAIDSAGSVTLFNAAALDLLDTNIELTGRPIADVMRLVDPEKKAVNIFELAKLTKYIQHRTDLVLPISENDQLALDINISRVSMAAPMNKQQGYIFLMRDITKEKSLEEERELFISEVSHELRTPITIAEANISMAGLQAAKDDGDKKSLAEAVDKAHKQVLFLADMVNDLSTLSRAERADAEMDVATFKIDEIIEELQKTYEPQAQKKNLYIHIDLAPDLPAVTTSRLYLKEIMQNFITNSIKYTQEGGLTIIAKLKDEQRLEIAIVDTGIGISKSEMNKVFQKFWRSEDPYTRSTGGTGLGLFITAKLAKRIGAEIVLESEVKQGSTFGLLLPVVAIQKIDQKNLVNNEVKHLFE